MILLQKMQNITVQRIVFHRVPRHPMQITLPSNAACGTPLKSLFFIDPTTNCAKLRELSNGYSLYEYRTMNARRTRRGFFAEASLGRQGTVKSSGTSARVRRLEKAREEKRRKELEKKKGVYPEWAKILEDACKDDKELREIIGDAMGNAELMKKRVEERVIRKGRDILQSKTGSALAVKVSFRDFNPIDSYIWIELYDAPSDRDVDFLGSAIRSWYVLGRLGGFNCMNLQLTELSINETPRYDVDKASKSLSSSFHDISNLEFQDNLARFWVDMGTSDPLALDVLINALICLSSDYIGIKQLVFGGKRLGDWEQGMTSVEDGYKVFKI
eukprot:Gb_14630 [translate_table: standard]